MNYHVIGRGFGKVVRLKPGDLQTWNDHRQSRPDSLMAHGILIGCTSESKKYLDIEAATSPMAGDERTRWASRLRDPGHQKIADIAFERSSGRSIYLGAWHTTPEPFPEPSAVDIDDWCQCVKRNHGRPLVFVLVGTFQINLYIPWGSKCRLLRAPT